MSKPATTAHLDRLAAELDHAEITVAADGDRIALIGQPSVIEDLVARIGAAPAPVECDDQLALFDASAYDTRPALRVAS